MAIDTSSFKTGLTIVQDGEVWQIVEFQHVKPGKGGAFVRTKLKQVKSGKTVDKTFRAGEKMEQAILERRPDAFVYASGESSPSWTWKVVRQTDVPARLLAVSGAVPDDQCRRVRLVGHTILVVDLPDVERSASVTRTDPGRAGEHRLGAATNSHVRSGRGVTVPIVHQRW